MKDLTSRISDFLSNHNVVNLAYYSDNSPQVCALWYASDDDLNLYYLSSLSTNHGSSLENGGRIAFTIQKDDQYWKDITGIQGRGTTEICSSDDAWTIYSDKFDFITQQFDDLEEALEETKLWKITPTWIRLIDNRVAFGHKEELMM